MQWQQVYRDGDCMAWVQLSSSSPSVIYMKAPGRVTPDLMSGFTAWYVSYVLQFPSLYWQVFDLEECSEGVSACFSKLLQFARGVRGQQEGRLVGSFALLRASWLRETLKLLLQLVPPTAPFEICSSLADVAEKIGTDFDRDLTDVLMED
jgi:hypothetical protein